MSRQSILITGGAGFIGTNFIKKIASQLSPVDFQFIILDALTYAGHYANIADDVEKYSHLTFIKGDIRDSKLVEKIFHDYNIDGVINFAAESHVDRSISGPNIFVETNVLGTLCLLNAALKMFNNKKNFRYLQISTDEVYGHLNENDPPFTETTPLAPRSPYSASKASADLLVHSFFTTYQLPIIITRCSNNYGPYQFPEKLIPLMIDRAIHNEKLPVYGQGLNIRDWIHVDDHNRGIWSAYQYGRAGEVYNFGGGAEKRNIDIVKLILAILNKDDSLIEYVTDRLGHDHRYAMDYSKAKRELGFTPKIDFETGLATTINSYLGSN